MLGKLRFDIGLDLSYALLVLFFHISSLLELIQQKVMLVNASLVEADYFLDRYLAIHHLLDLVQWLAEQIVHNIADPRLKCEPMQFKIT